MYVHIYIYISIHVHTSMHIYIYADINDHTTITNRFDLLRSSYVPCPAEALRDSNKADLEKRLLEERVNDSKVGGT